MKKITLLAALLFTFILGHSQVWTPNATTYPRFVAGGVTFGRGDTTSFKAAKDTNIVVYNYADSSLYMRQKGFYRKIPFSGAGSGFALTDLSNVLTTANLSIPSGTVSAGALTVTGNISAATLSGIITSPTQINITRVGSLTGLTTTGAIIQPVLSSLLKSNIGGQIVAAIAGTDYLISTPFTEPTTGNIKTANASTSVTFGTFSSTAWGSGTSVIQPSLLASILSISPTGDISAASTRIEFNRYLPAVGGLSAPIVTGASSGIRMSAGVIQFTTGLYQIGGATAAIQTSLQVDTLGISTSLRSNLAVVNSSSLTVTGTTQIGGSLTVTGRLNIISPVFIATSGLISPTFKMLSNAISNTVSIPGNFNGITEIRDQVDGLNNQLFYNVYGGVNTNLVFGAMSGTKAVPLTTNTNRVMGIIGAIAYSQVTGWFSQQSTQMRFVAADTLGGGNMLFLTSALGSVAPSTKFGMFHNGLFNIGSAVTVPQNGNIRLNVQAGSVRFADTLTGTSAVFQGNLSVTGNTTIALSSGSAGDFLVHNSNTLVTRTAAQVLSDIGAAPSTGSSNYIQNQIASAQSGSAWVSGDLRATGALRVGPTPMDIYQSGSSLRTSFGWIVDGNMTVSGGSSTYMAGVSGISVYRGGIGFAYDATNYSVLYQTSTSNNVTLYNSIIGNVFQFHNSGRVLMGQAGLPADNSMYDLIVGGPISATNFVGAGTGLTGTATALNVGGYAAKWGSTGGGYTVDLSATYSTGFDFLFARTTAATEGRLINAAALKAWASYYTSGDNPTFGTVTATTFTGNAATTTALQTARTIQGVSFDGTANINIINGTGFVKASGTTISYDNSTYLTTSSAASTYAALSGASFTGQVFLPNNFYYGTKNTSATNVSLIGLSASDRVAIGLGGYSVDMSGSLAVVGAVTSASESTGALTATGRINAAGITNTAQATYAVGLSSQGNLVAFSTTSSGTGGTGAKYVPTISSIMNTGSLTVTASSYCSYTRDGNIVTVYVTITDTPPASGFSAFTVSLPIASTQALSTGVQGAAGSATAYYAGAGQCTPNGNTATFGFFTATLGVSHICNFSFQYEVQ